MNSGLNATGFLRKEHLFSSAGLAPGGTLLVAGPTDVVASVSATDGGSTWAKPSTPAVLAVGLVCFMLSGDAAVMATPEVRVHPSSLGAFQQAVVVGEVDAQWRDFLRRVLPDSSPAVLAAANRFWNFARNAGRIPPMPEAGAGTDGHLQFMWKDGASTLLVDVYADGVKWFFGNPKTGEMADGRFTDPSAPPASMIQLIPRARV